MAKPIFMKFCELTEIKVPPAINWSGLEVKVIFFVAFDELSSRKKCDFLKNEKMTLKT
jgi:hypothetical protein